MALARAIFGQTMQVTIRKMPFCVDLEYTGVNFEVLCTRSLEPAECAFFKRLLKQADTVADIGANIGFLTALFAEIVGPTGLRIAFEPDPRTFALLERDVRLRGLDGIAELVHAAIGAETGTATLHAVERGNCGDQRMYRPSEATLQVQPPRKSIDVPIMRFDDCFAGRPRLDAIKIDIQEIEGRTLAGMRAARQRFPEAVMLMEYWPFGLREAGSDPRDVLGELRRGDAIVYELDPRGMILPFDEDALDFLERSGRHVNVVVGGRDRLRSPR